MKWVCLMANMAVPGVGSLIAKRFGSGVIQVVGSLFGFVMFGYCVMEFYGALKVYTANLDEPETMVQALKGLGGKMTQPLIIGGVGVLILKVAWIWAQVTTAQVFKAEKEAEAQVPPPPPPVDSSN